MRGVEYLLQDEAKSMLIMQNFPHDREGGCKEVGNKAASDSIYVEIDYKRGY